MGTHLSHDQAIQEAPREHQNLLEAIEAKKPFEVLEFMVEQIRARLAEELDRPDDGTKDEGIIKLKALMEDIENRKY